MDSAKFDLRPKPLPRPCPVRISQKISDRMDFLGVNGLRVGTVETLTPSYEEKNSGGIKSPKQTTTAKITKKHNEHTGGEFVFIILLKKRGYFVVFSVVNQRYFFPHTTSYKAFKFSTVLV